MSHMRELRLREGVEVYVDGERQRGTIDIGIPFEPVDMLPIRDSLLASGLDDDSVELAMIRLNRIFNNSLIQSAFLID